MASNVSTIDGMGFEEVNQLPLEREAGANIVYGYHISGVTVEAQEISGTNVYADTNVVADRIYGNEFVSGLLIKGTTISGTNIVNNEGKLQSVSIGSGTAVYGAVTQAGSGVLASNDAWIVFPTAYTGLPTVVVSNRDDVDADLHLSAGSLNVGSFHVIGTNATDNFSWIGVGI